MDPPRILHYFETPKYEPNLVNTVKSKTLWEVFKVEKKKSIINQNYRALFVRVVVRRRMKQRKAIRPGVGVLIIPTRDREQSPALEFVNMKKSWK